MSITDAASAPDRANGTTRAPGIGRLVMVAGAYRKWPLAEATCDTHATFLRHVLSSEAVGSEAVGGAWLAAIDEERRRTPVPSRPRALDPAPPEGPAVEALLDPREWTAGCAGIAPLMADLRESVRRYLCLPEQHRPALEEQLRAMRHRVFIDRDRFLHLIRSAIQTTLLHVICAEVSHHLVRSILHHIRHLTGTIHVWQSLGAVITQRLLASGARRLIRH